MSTPHAKSQTGDSAETNRTQAAYRRARQIIPGGTQLLSKRPEMFAPEVWPAYYAEARGCEVVDLDGRRYVDMTTSGIGSCLLGYADPDVTEAVVRRVRNGSMCTLNCVEELELAEALLELHPWAERARFCRGGGEAMAVAVRIARAATGRDHVAFCGYHGWSDWYLAANLPDAQARRRPPIRSSNTCCPGCSRPACRRGWPARRCRFRTTGSTSWNRSPASMAGSWRPS